MKRQVISSRGEPRDVGRSVREAVFWKSRDTGGKFSACAQWCDGSCPDEVAVLAQDEMRGDIASRPGRDESGCLRTGSVEQAAERCVSSAPSKSGLNIPGCTASDGDSRLSGNRKLGASARGTPDCGTCHRSVQFAIQARFA